MSIGKKSLFILFVILFAAVSASSAETGAFPAVFDDALKAVKDPVDLTWEQTIEEVRAAADTLEGYTCGAADEKITCEKTDPEGSCRIEFDFANGKLAAIDTYLSNSELSNYDISSNAEDYDVPMYMRYLWYSENDRRFFTDFEVDDSIIEKLTGKPWRDAQAEYLIDVSRYEKILPGNDTTWSEYFFSLSENTFVQSGYQDVSENDPRFQLRILLSSWKYLVLNQSPIAYRKFSGSGVIYEKEISNEKDSCIAVSYYNSKGEPVIHPEYGYAKEIKYYGGDISVEGLPVPHPDRLTVYLDLENNAVMNSSGYAYCTEEISEDGNTSTVRFFDSEMKPTAHESGYSAYTLETIGDAMTSSRTTKIYKYYDINMDPFIMEEGYAGYSVTSGAPGMSSVTTEYFDAEGKPVLIAGGYAADVYYKYSPGLTEYHSYYGVDGEPVLTDNGYASFGHEPAGEGRGVIYYYRGVNGEPVIGPEGYAVKEVVYGSEDPQPRERFLDADGNLTLCNDGYAYMTETETEEGSIERYYDTEGNRAVNRSVNASAIHTIYDPSGEVVRKEYLGVNDEPVLSTSGYAVKEVITDEGERSVRYLDTENKPVLNKEGYAYSVEEFGDNESVLRYYDPEGSRVSNQFTNVSAVHFFYGPSGKKVRIDCLDTDDKLIPPDKLDHMRIYYEYGLESGITYTNWE